MEQPSSNSSYWQIYHVIGFEIPHYVLYELFLRLDQLDQPVPPRSALHLWAPYELGLKTTMLRRLVRRLLGASCFEIMGTEVHLPNHERRFEVHVIFFRRRLEDQSQTDAGSQLPYNQMAFEYCRQALGAPQLRQYILKCPHFDRPSLDLPFPRSLQLYESQGSPASSESGIMPDTRKDIWLPEDVLDNIFSILRDVRDEDMFPPWWIGYSPVWTNLRALCQLTRVCKAWRISAARATLRIVAMDIHRHTISSLATMLDSLNGQVTIHILYLSYPWKETNHSDDETIDLITRLVSRTPSLSQLYLDNFPTEALQNQSFMDSLHNLYPATLCAYGLRGIGLNQIEPGLSYYYPMAALRRESPTCIRPPARIDKFPPLKNITALAIAGLNLSTISTLYQHPILAAIYHLHLSVCWFPPGLFALAGGKNLKTIVLDRCIVYGADLYGLLKISTSLKRLEYKDSVVDSPPYPESLRQFKTMPFSDEALLGTLQELAGRAEIKEIDGYPFFPDRFALF